MKKLLLLFVGILCSLSSVWAADVTHSLYDVCLSNNEYIWSLSSTQGARNKVVYVEVISANTSGDITFVGSGNNTRYLYIYPAGGETKDEDRKITMNTSSGNTISYTTADVFQEDGKYYLKFSTTDDFKYTSVKTTMSTTDPTYIVTFNSNGGSAVSNQTVVSGGHAFLTDEPVRVAHNFLGWSETLNGSVVDIRDIEITADKTFYAKWSEELSKDFDFTPIGLNDENFANVYLKLNDVLASTINGIGKVYGIKNNTSVLYNKSGLSLAGGGADIVSFELAKKLKAGSQIVVKFKYQQDNQERGVLLKDYANKNTVSKLTILDPTGVGQNPVPTAIVTRMYTVQAGDKLVGTNGFKLVRNNTMWIQSIEVYNAGDDAETAPSVSVPVTSAGWASLCLPFDAVVPANATAYYASNVTNSSIVLNAINAGEKIPAGEGVLVNAAEGNHDFAVATGAIAITNKFKGTVAATNLTENQNYVLAEVVSESPVFKLYANSDEGAGTISLAANKAYLPASVRPAGSSAKSMSVIFNDGTTTGISNIAAPASSKTNAVKVIKNGKLVIETAKGTYNVAGSLIK